MTCNSPGKGPKCFPPPPVCGSCPAGYRPVGSGCSRLAVQETPKQYVPAEVITDARPCLTTVDCKTWQRRFGYDGATSSNAPGSNPCTWGLDCATCRPGETLTDGTCCPAGNPDKIFIQQDDHCVKCPKGYKVRTGKLPYFGGARETAEVCEIAEKKWLSVGTCDRLHRWDAASQQCVL